MENKDILIVFFALSLLAHIVFFKFFKMDSTDLNAAELSQIQEHNKKVIPVKIAVEPIAKVAADKLDAHQVIELPPGPDEQPDHAKYLAERAMKAEREVMARPGGNFAGHNSPPVSNQELFQSKPEPTDSQNGSEPQNEKGTGMAEKFKLLPKEAAELFSRSPESVGNGIPGHGNGGGIDFLSGAASGDITFANAYKFKYAGFFNQLKRSISFYWNPQPALYLLPVKSNELITTVRFIYNQDGTLADTEILSSSQYEAVDRAALSAIKNSSPVFNLPQELLDQNHQLALTCEFRILLNQR